MFKFIAIVLMALVAFAAAKPAVVAPLAYTAPVIGASAVYSREYHGNFAAPYVAAAAAPYVAASPYVASPYVASPYVSSPYVASPYTYAAASPYVAAPYAATAAYSAPLLLKK